MQFKPFAILIFTLALGLVPILAFITIFIFKKRNLQIKLIWIIIFLILIYYFTTLYACIGLHVDVKEIFTNFSLYFNLVNLILCDLAIRAIKKDENLVRAADRLR